MSASNPVVFFGGFPDGARCSDEHQKDFPFEIRDGAKTIFIVQKRWYLENKKVGVAITDDPGGAVVEFINKETKTNHVAGQVYSYAVDGVTRKNIYYGWKDLIADGKSDPLDKRILMQYSPGTSLEVFAQSGKRIFSQTYMRPPGDAVAIEKTFPLPAGEVLRLGDKVNIVFPDLKEIPLYLNRDGVFDLP